jgi:Zn-dependent protease
MRAFADDKGMSRLRNPELTLVRQPLPVSISDGGVVPVLLFGAIFAACGARAGLPIATATIVGAFGGTLSLLAHELGHVRAAQKVGGLRPIGVSLIWLGAVTRIEGTYVTGRDQARVAVAGPVASFKLALLTLPVFALPVPMSIKEFVLGLGVLNLALGALNLIPVYPLDGYKLSIGLMWSLLGSETAAQRLFRRVMLPWIVVELVGTAVLLVERPALGATALALGGTLFAQKVYARRRA